MDIGAAEVLSLVAIIISGLSFYRVLHTDGGLTRLQRILLQSRKQEDIWDAQIKFRNNSCYPISIVHVRKLVIVGNDVVQDQEPPMLQPLYPGEEIKFGNFVKGASRVDRVYTAMLIEYRRHFLISSTQYHFDICSFTAGDSQVEFVSIDDYRKIKPKLPKWILKHIDESPCPCGSRLRSKTCCA